MTNEPEMGFGLTLAYLTAGILNGHIFRCATEESCEEPCCPECCAPCHALRSLRDYQDEWLGYQLSRWNHNEDGQWSWQLPTGNVDWQMVERHWRTDMGCHDEGDESGAVRVGLKRPRVE